MIQVHDCVYIVTEKQTSVKRYWYLFLSELGATHLCLECLLDYYPLPTYEMFDLSLIVFHHTLLKNVKIKNIVLN